MVNPVADSTSVVTHHFADVGGTRLHYTAAGAGGSPVLLVHGFPESWWAFNRLIPLLAARHRVVAVDLRGFGDSDPADPGDISAAFTEDLHELVAHLGLGPVHLLVQDISGGVGFRLATGHPEDLESFTAVETGLAGFGLEALADVTHGGAWYIGLLTTPGAAEAFFSGRASQLIGDFIMPSFTRVPNAVTPEDVAELARGYERSGGWNGAAALYGSMLREGDEMKALARAGRLTLPALAVDRSGGSFARRTLEAVHDGAVEAAEIDGTGHYIALEAAPKLAAVMLDFLERTDAVSRAAKNHRTGRRR